MTDKTDLWDRLGKTDPAHTKPFKRAGGFSGTAIKPMWSFRRMTEEYGPCGVGWGVNEPSFQVVHSTDEALVYCTVSIWHGKRENIVFGVGGDKAVGKFKSGAFTDDEAFKKAFTDAVTNALKLIGVGADVHMGLFDDNKYVNDLRAEFGDDKVDQVDTQYEASRRRYIETTTQKILTWDDPDRDSIYRWWHAEPQKLARRDFDIDQPQIDQWKQLITQKAPPAARNTP
jgi:hypothetical protein